MLKKSLLLSALVLTIFIFATPAFAQFGLKETARQAQYGETDIVSLVGSIISIVLSFIGLVFLAIMFYAGLRWMTARGNEEFATKAKDAMFNATVGLILVVASYGIATFIFNQLAK